ncbi:hypothetical protein CYLTODRAFT_443746 [Cylindrobasidium torrendii FP15055 ss-10]|uniref:Uncharacterized protein n=1 Tax=Cylindrobasidium torrendii FP15055 ss-10 TaxID=1314674 RepID=A0A0D7BCA1_9AGAR|nr:hypothetical protein CYLTODRAFT_443746 [Cylindrobasidium torrendii FP15055 ss-10]
MSAKSNDALAAPAGNFAHESSNSDSVLSTSVEIRQQGVHNTEGQACDSESVSGLSDTTTLCGSGSPSPPRSVSPVRGRLPVFRGEEAELDFYDWIMEGIDRELWESQEKEEEKERQMEEPKAVAEGSGSQGRKSILEHWAANKRPATATKTRTPEE